MKTILNLRVLAILCLAGFYQQMNAQVFLMDAETASYIDAGAYSPQSEVILFFSGSALMVYDIAASEMQEAVWYDLEEMDEINAAVSWDDDEVLLFQGTSFRTFQVSTATFTTELEEWLGLPDEWNGMLDAAARWSEDEVMFFKGDQFLLYSFSANEYIAYENYTIWDGWPETWDTALEAVFNIGGDIYFFNDGETAMFSVEDQTFFLPSPIGFASEGDN